MKNNSPMPTFVKYLRQLRHSRMALAILVIYVAAEILLVGVPKITDDAGFMAYAAFAVGALAIAPLLLASVLATCWYQDRSNPGCDPVSTTPLTPVAMMGGLNLACLAIIVGIFLLSVPALVRLFANLGYSDISATNFFMALALGIPALTATSAALFMLPPSNIKGKNISNGMIIVVLVFLQPMVIGAISAVSDADGIEFLFSGWLMCFTVWLYAFSVSTSQCIPASGNRRIWPRLATLTIIFVLLPLIQYLGTDYYGRPRERFFTESWAVWSIGLVIIDLLAAINDPVIPSQRILRNHASTPFRRIVSFLFAPGAVNGWVFSAAAMAFVSLMSVEWWDFEGTHFCFVVLFYAATAIFVKDRFPQLNLSGFALFAIIAAIFILPAFLKAFDVGGWCLYTSPFVGPLNSLEQCVLTFVFLGASAILIAPSALRVVSVWWGRDPERNPGTAA